MADDYQTLIKISFSKILNARNEKGGVKLHRNLMILRVLQRLREDQKQRVIDEYHRVNRINDENTRVALNQCQMESSTSCESTIEYVLDEEMLESEDGCVTGSDQNESPAQSSELAMKNVDAIKTCQKRKLSPESDLAPETSSKRIMTKDWGNSSCDSVESDSTHCSILRSNSVNVLMEVSIPTQDIVIEPLNNSGDAFSSSHVAPLIRTYSYPVLYSGQMYACR